MTLQKYFSMHIGIFLILYKCTNKLKKVQMYFWCTQNHVCCGIYVQTVESAWNCFSSIWVRNFWNFVTLTDSQTSFLFVFFKQGIVFLVKKKKKPLLPITWTRHRSQKPCCQIGNFATWSGDFQDTTDDLNCQKRLTTSLPTFSARQALTPRQLRDKRMWKQVPSSGPFTSSGCCHNPSQLLKHSGGQSHWVAAQRTWSLSHNTVGLQMNQVCTRRLPKTQPFD